MTVILWYKYTRSSNPLVTSTLHTVTQELNVKSKIPLPLHRHAVTACCQQINWTWNRLFLSSYRGTLKSSDPLQTDIWVLEGRVTKQYCWDKPSFSCFPMKFSWPPLFCETPELHPSLESKHRIETTNKKSKSRLESINRLLSPASD